MPRLSYRSDAIVAAVPRQLSSTHNFIILEQRIIQFWDDILRFIATIKPKETTASDIFRRLNSQSKQHGLYQALKAFGQPLKSLFILRVIDEPVLRMSIEKGPPPRRACAPLHSRGPGRQSARISVS